jgi:hypothetical protein
MKEWHMQDSTRGCLAALLSWKLGGGIFSTVILFLVIYALLKHC